jgi:hypothetical protein
MVDPTTLILETCYVRELVNVLLVQRLLQERALGLPTLEVPLQLEVHVTSGFGTLTITVRSDMHFQEK